MNLAHFFEHWRIAENPFRGEEARHDSVFARMGLGGGSAASGEAGPSERAAVSTHSDFEKILGDLSRPATSIVFGEKGSGKTAIRLQIAQRIAEHNSANPKRRVLLIAYDDLNAVLDRFAARTGGADPAETLRKLRLVDHIDAVLSRAVPGIVDAVLGSRQREGDAAVEAAGARKLLDAAAKRDLLLLQAIYDRPDEGDIRTGQLRRALRVPPVLGRIAWACGAIIAWLAAGGIAGASMLHPQLNTGLWQKSLLIASAVFGGGALVMSLKVFAWDRMMTARLAHRVNRQLRVLSRGDRSLARSLAQLDPLLLSQGTLPATDSDEQRYAMLDRLRRVIACVGYTGIVVVLDRIDEPTLISGNAERMQAVIWPLLNNKFLQQSGIGMKLLLPVELRHALLRESSAFYQEARLDKQNLVERLSWTGAMLYDLCDARLKACLQPGAPRISLLDLFAEDVTRQDLVDALDQMHQPRDAFKFLYSCLNEHCSNVTREEEQWRVPRLILETIRKQQAERVQALYRGISPS